jgi:hypothetical protein
MVINLQDVIPDKIRHSPVISIDFLLKYLAFGPSRDRINQSATRLPYVYVDPILEIPKELLDVAQAARSESGDLSERIIQRRIRDAMDRERMKVGPVQLAGLDGAVEAIAGMF